jgi:hypothetical protein
MTGTQAYDGKAGWSVMPFGGRTEPEAMAPEELLAAREQADFEGPLVNYRGKGYAIELMGKERVGGGDAYRLKVTFDSGAVRDVYVDADQYLVVKMEGKRRLRGADVESETTYADYQRVAGVLFPSSTVTVFKGTPVTQRLTIETIQVNVPIDDRRFARPSSTPQR